MLELEYREAELQALQYERYNHPHRRVMLKMEVLYLKCKGYKNEVISAISGVCDNRIRK
jgi:hypothetical protein